MPLKLKLILEDRECFAAGFKFYVPEKDRQGPSENRGAAVSSDPGR